MPTHLGFGFGPQPATVAKVADQVLVVERVRTEPAFGQIVRCNERFDILEQIGHEGLMGEISPKVKPQWGKFNHCHEGGWFLYNGRMGADIETIRAAIKAAMTKRGISRRQLSKDANLSESAVRDLLTRTDNPGISTLYRIADALEMPVDEVTGSAMTVPVLGRIGAGGAILFDLDQEEVVEDVEVRQVPRPPLTPGKLMALEVSGSSMLPKYEDGEIIYVRRDHDGILPQYIGRYCAVRTADGGTFLKILAQGSEPDRFTLRSLNAPDMENVEIVWASPVLFVMPKQPEIPE